jgi:hypothetical protein
MSESTTTSVPPTLSGREILTNAQREVERARHQLELFGVVAVRDARMIFESAIARLHPLIANDDVPGDVRRSAERCRSTLSSHLLAAEDLEAAGLPQADVALLLQRATDAFDVAAKSDGRSH